MESLAFQSGNNPEFQLLFWTNSCTTGLLTSLQLTNKDLFILKWKIFLFAMKLRHRILTQVDLSGAWFLIHSQYWKIRCSQYIFTFFLEKCCYFHSFKSRLLLIFFGGKRNIKYLFLSPRDLEGDYTALPNYGILWISISPVIPDLIFLFWVSFWEKKSYPHIIKTVIYYFLSGFILQPNPILVPEIKLHPFSCRVELSVDLTICEEIQSGV